ncbi:Zygote arrest protein 1 [Bulinus truncatus]|nr:Zygote arrest protein 1 [Bulinus truncatus]
MTYYIALENEVERIGTYQAEYGQECKDCHVMCDPYRVERLRCSMCRQTVCICEERHVNLNKNHRSDLCGKCRAGDNCV